MRTLSLLTCLMVAMLLLAANPAIASVSLTSFGATCDGVTDDTVAIRSAVSSLVPRGGTLTIPRSNTPCVYSGTITAISNLHLVGEGSQGDGDTSALSPSTLKYIGAGSAISCGGGTAQVHNLVLQDFTLEGSSAATAGIAMVGSSLNFCVRAVVDRVTVMNFLGTDAAGMLITAGVSILVDASCFSQNYNGVVINGNAGTTTIHFRDVSVRTNVRYGYFLQDEIQNLTIDGSAGVIESNGSSAIHGDFTSANAAGLTIRDIFIGNSNQGGLAENAQVILAMSGNGYVHNVVIDHVYFGDAGSSGDIQIQAVSADIRNVFGAARVSHAIVRVVPGSGDIRCHQIVAAAGGWVHPACLQY